MIQDKFSFKLPEGLIWNNHTNSYLFVDIKLNSIFDYKDGLIKLIHTFSESISFVFPTSDKNRLICGMKSGIYIFDIFNKKLERIYSMSKKNYRTNDGFIDQNKILWFGTMHENDKLINESNKGCLYSYSLSKGLIIEDEDYFIPNGPVISDDGKWLYHSDSLRGIIYIYKYKKQGLDLKTKEIFVDANQYSQNNPSPDGMTINSDGNLMVAIWGVGEIWEISPNAILINRHTSPGKNTTNICYGGAKLNNLVGSFAESPQMSGGLFEISDSKTKGKLLSFEL